MLTRPATISDRTVLEFVTDLWTAEADRAEYSPVGFGSHHWLLGTAQGWKRFVTVDDLVAKRRSLREPLEGSFVRLQAASRSIWNVMSAPRTSVACPAEGVRWR